MDITTRGSTHYPRGRSPSPGTTDPRDVAIIFHAHLLSPFRFYADMYSRGPRPVLIHSKISFPLERMHELIANGVWSDEQSEGLWKRAYPQTPYQLWDTDPLTTNSNIRFQDIDMICPWCDKVIVVNIANFTNMHTLKTVQTMCPKCGIKFDADRLSARNLQKDLLRFVASENSKDTWYPHDAVFQSDLVGW
jgi:hypothetical protein